MTAPIAFIWKWDITSTILCLSFLPKPTAVRVISCVQNMNCYKFETTWDNGFGQIGRGNMLHLVPYHNANVNIYMYSSTNCQIYIHLGRSICQVLMTDHDLDWGHRTVTKLLIASLDHSLNLLQARWSVFKLCCKS